jgi:hypothetical protein
VTPSNGFALAKAIAIVTQVTEADKVAKNLVTVMEVHSVTVELIRVNIDLEVKLASEFNDIECV